MNVNRCVKLKMLSCVYTHTFSEKILINVNRINLKQGGSIDRFNVNQNVTRIPNNSEHDLSTL